MSKLVYTLAEPGTNWTLLKNIESSCLNSARLGLTDRCLVPLFDLRKDKTGSDEITLREPQYVFAVNVYLLAHRHSEVDDATDWKTTSCLTAAKSIHSAIDRSKAHMC